MVGNKKDAGIKFAGRTPVVAPPILSAGSFASSIFRLEGS